MEYRDIIFEPGAVTRLILNRPRYHNAQPPRMVEEMDDAFGRAVADPQTRVVILSGAGAHFSAGHDEKISSHRAEGYTERANAGAIQRRRLTRLDVSQRWPPMACMSA